MAVSAWLDSEKPWLIRSSGNRLLLLFRHPSLGSGEIARAKNELDSGINGIWLRARVEIGADNKKSKSNRFTERPHCALREQLPLEAFPGSIWISQVDK